MAKRTTTSAASTTRRKSAPKVASKKVSTAQVGEAIGNELHEEKQNPTMAPTSTSTTDMAREMRQVTHDMIASRAHSLWKKNGGSDLENWLQAERELRGQNMAST